MDQKHMLTRLFDSETHFIISHLTRRLKWHTQIHTQTFSTVLFAIYSLLPLHHTSSTLLFTLTLRLSLTFLAYVHLSLQSSNKVTRLFSPLHRMSLFSSRPFLFQNVYCGSQLFGSSLLLHYPVLFAFPSLPGKTLSNKQMEKTE